MAKKKQKPKQRPEPDSAYFLKLVLYVIIGSQWVRLVNPEMSRQIPIPIGFIVGLMFASHEHFQIDRKIEYAVLIVAMLISFWAEVGFYITVLK